MLIEAPQYIPKEIKNLNQYYLENLKGYLNDKEAGITLVNFLRNNPRITIDLLTGGDVVPYAFQEMIIKCWSMRNYSCNVWGRGASKTKVYSNNQKVISKSHGMIGLEDLIPNLDFSQGERWVSIPETQLWNGNSWQLTNKILLQPKKEAWRLKTKHGYEIEVAPTHKMKFLNKETCKIEWLRVGEADFDKHYLCISRNKCNWGQQNFTNEEIKEAYIVGLIIGGGRFSKKTITITSVDKEIIDLFPFESVYCKDEAKTKNVSLKKEFLSYICEKYNLNYNKSYTKYIPQKILSSSVLTKEFLRGVFDIGAIICKKSFKISFCSTSKKLATQIHDVLLTFGIVCNLIKRKTNSKLSSTYIISIYEENSYKFTKEIGFNLSIKNNICSDYIFQNKKFNTNNDFVYGAKYFLQKNIKLNNKLFTEYGDVFYEKNNKEISYQKLKQYLEFVKKCNFDEDLYFNLLEIQKENFFFDSIESIEKFESDCIDFNIPNGEMYWGNGFINHNSFTVSLFTLFHAIFNPGIKILIASSNFRTSRRIMDQIEIFVNSKNAHMLRQCFNNKMKRLNDGWSWEINGGYISAIPLTEGTRGQRCDVLICDEFLLLPEEMVRKVLFPFLSATTDQNYKQKVRRIENKLIKEGLLKEEERMQFGSQKKMIALSSASYEFEYLYRMYKDYSGNILGDEYSNPDFIEDDEENRRATYFISQISYNGVPPDMIDKTIIEEAESSGSNNAVFLREYCAQFVDDSDNFFSAKLMANCTIKNGESPCIELKGEAGAEYILSIDPNVASNAYNDHFAMSVLKINRETQSGVLVHQYARAGVEYSEHIEYLLFLITYFNIVYLNVDSMGGEQFIEACNNSYLFKQNNIHLGFVKGDFDSPEQLREIKKTYNVTNKVYCYSQKFLSSWIRTANEHLQSCIDPRNRKIWFASKLAFHPSFKSNLSLNLPIIKVDPKIHVDKEAAMLDFIEWQDSWMDMVKKQCSLVETKVTSLGQLNFDIPSHLKKSTKADRARKDSYSTLLLNMWGLKQFFEIESAPNSNKEMFVPFFIG